jgi:hypothetical protein
VQGGDGGGLHVDGAAAVQPAVLDHARPRAVAPGRAARVHDVDVPVEADAAPRPAGERRGQAPQLGPLGLLAGVARMPAQRREVVGVQIGLEPQGGRGFGEELEHGPLVAGHARHAQRGGRVAGEGAGVERRQRGGLDLRDAVAGAHRGHGARRPCNAREDWPPGRVTLEGSA